MEIRQDTETEVSALIAKIRTISLLSVIYGIVLAAVLVFTKGSGFFWYTLWVECAALTAAGLWACLSPSRTNLLICAVVHCLVAVSSLLTWLVYFTASVVFAVLYFIRYSDICGAEIPRRSPVCLCPPEKAREDMIRITVITLVDNRVWKCVFGEEQLLILGRRRHESYTCHKGGDIRILGSNARKPWAKIKFTLRLNGEIYRCKAGRLAYNKLALWIEEGRWQTANEQSDIRS